MPKRVIDGDALWVSEKLTTVPEKYRAEYAWILPLAQVNGCFECRPMLVWRTCYSAIRTEWKIDDVAEILDAFEVAKMIFRWKVDGKTFGFFIGIQKEGRLPKPSDRVKSAKQWQSGMVPAKELAKFLGLTARDVTEEYGELVASKSRVGRELVANGSPTGNGIGIGVGKGEGIGSGVGFGSEALQQHSTTSETNQSLSNTEHSNTSPIPSDAEGFARLFHKLMESNPHSTNIPTKWEPLWKSSFANLLRSVSAPDLTDIILVSQLEKYQQYYIRPIKLVDNLELLKKMVEERQGVLPALRAKLPLDVDDEKFPAFGDDWDDIEQTT